MKAHKNTLQKFAVMIVSNFLVALAVSKFIAPHGIIMGGSTGIALTITHYFHLPLSSAVLVINILLFLLGFFFFGKKFALSTLTNSLLYPIMLALLEMTTAPVSPTAIVMLAAIFGGVLLGCGDGLILRAGGSSGGTDILALVFNKYLHSNVSLLLYIIDGCILGSQLPFSNSEQILLGIFMLALFTLTMNKIMVMGKIQIQLLIISDQIETIREKLLLEEDTGATLFAIEKGFTGIQGHGILCVIPRRKLYYVSEMIAEIDPEAFFTISEVNEVRGRGFSLAKRYKNA
ncbi:MAG: YitT family protein [Acidaminococcaceae bacterium]|nr:YitT family protein [Acidaminococcaceae bacterium]MBO6039147.1 YitT family protein [Acidaminococcaceae bacterium]